MTRSRGEKTARVPTRDVYFDVPIGTIRIVLCAMLVMPWAWRSISANDLPRTVAQTQPKIVKIFGAGGLRRLEHYQTGIFVSPDGLILTTWSYVLDTDAVVAVLHDGQRLDATLVGFDPELEIALLRVEVTEQDHFRLVNQAPRFASRILAFSNLYGVATGNEPVSVQHGVIAARTKLAARHGSIDAAYQGPVLLLDAITSNPGAGGGAVTDLQGNLLGLIGKEMQSRDAGTWLNFALPVAQLIQSVQRIETQHVAAQGRPAAMPTEPMTLELLGLGLVPDVLARTPPYVDYVVSGSPAQRAGLMPDDLLVEVAGVLVASRSAVVEQLKSVDRDQSLEILVQRGSKFLEMRLSGR